ncbi:MAG: efflux RND transporter permease subunit [Candidatus Sedimenticola endophacoides]
MAAFLPLMLLPGILGDFMLVIPLVVTIALGLSLLEAYWMLPAHILGAGIDFQRPTPLHARRVRALHWIRVRYTRLLVRAMRWPKNILLTLAITFAAALGGAVKLDFFASDPVRLFYVNIEMPADTPLDITLEKVLEVERKVRTGVRPGEVRETLAYAGQMFTETAPSFGDHYGQVLVSINPRSEGLREVDAMIEGLRARIEATPGPLKLSFLRRASGPPPARSRSRCAATRPPGSAAPSPTSSRSCAVIRRSATSPTTTAGARWR